MCVFPGLEKKGYGLVLLPDWQKNEISRISDFFIGYKICMPVS